VLNSSYYNASTGILTTPKIGDYENGWSWYVDFTLYLIDEKIEM